MLYMRDGDAQVNFSSLESKLLAHSQIEQHLQIGEADDSYQAYIYFHY
jgi:hypothetical protein